MLESLVERYPDGTFLPLVFSRLETLYRRDPKPDLADIRRWTADDTKINRQTLALLTLGRVEVHLGDTDQAEHIFVQLVEEFPDHPLHARALVDLAALRLRSGRPQDARATLNQARPQIASLAQGNGAAATGNSGSRRPAACPQPE